MHDGVVVGDLKNHLAQGRDDEEDDTTSDGNEEGYRPRYVEGLTNTIQHNQTREGEGNHH